ncbi:TPA: hypothetical protein ACTNZI_001094 [Salmonella enterica subsp. enterica serovar Enteritidis]
MKHSKGYVFEEKDD